ncbi:MAG: hypothetical protein WCB27_13645 [Thermoguttaceae bacterium]
MAERPILPPRVLMLLGVAQQTVSDWFSTTNASDGNGCKKPPKPDAREKNTQKRVGMLLGVDRSTVAKWFSHTTNVNGHNGCKKPPKPDAREKNTQKRVGMLLGVARETVRNWLADNGTNGRKANTSAPRPDARGYALEAERRMGELLAATPRAKPPPGPGRGKKSVTCSNRLFNAPTLAELGITKRESSQAKLLADLPRPSLTRCYGILAALAPA